MVLKRSVRWPTTPIVTVTAVDPKGSAADSGIQVNDIIVQVQRTPVSEPDQALRLIGVQASLQRQFAAVLIERGKERFWISLAIPT